MLHDQASQDHGTYQWQRQTIAETYTRIISDPEHPWLALGDFLDDWRFTTVADRPELVSEPIALVEDNLEVLRWGAFCAATVEWLCRQDGLPFPSWTSQPKFVLSDPWFLYPGDLLRAWQLATTPVPFKMRNIFGGDQMLDRV
ncbi:MAG TPA: hypothetical protein VIG30_07175 [Ktedonobacterales bacterium]